MLKRLYVDNYRCFVNFEVRFGQHQLVLGLNGTGKSTLLDVLRSIRDLIAGDVPPERLFPSASRTRWQTLSQQSFELDAEIDGVSYRFIVGVDQWGVPARTRVVREIVLCDGRPIFEFEDGEVHLYNDSFQKKVAYPFDWFRSALATIQRRPENTRLMRFKDWLSNLHCLHLDPRQIPGHTDREDPRPSDDMSNFAAWYRHQTQERGDRAGALRESLRRVIPGFESLDLRSAGGSVRNVVARFGAAGDNRESYDINFSELSEGQQALICLYAILEFLVERGSCLFLDEPENFAALAEIQPWLMSLADRLEDTGGQAILISHHPELIDYLAAEAGIVLERAGAGPVRSRPFPAGDSPLRVSEQVARGWPN
ncbi:MAG: AAA family ATPase [Acidobacteria bacterium]|nr:AAA family ATPase [Acidobacteriota bacterium]